MTKYMPKERAKALLAQAEAAILCGGTGIDITNIPSDELLEAYRAMRPKKDSFFGFLKRFFRLR